MANNSFNSLLADVNKKISEMYTALSAANSATIAAREAASEAAAQALVAQKTITTANDASVNAIGETQKWQNAEAQAETLEAGSEATASVEDLDNKKLLKFGIPRGANGADGPKGDTGRSGVTFQLLGTKLYITTE